jgi:hypothetical protein
MMSVSQQLAAVLVELEAEDVAVVTVDARDHGRDHGMKACGLCSQLCNAPALTN